MHWHSILSFITVLQHLFVHSPSSPPPPPLSSFPEELLLDYVPFFYYLQIQTFYFNLVSFYSTLAKVSVTGYLILIYKF